MNNADAIDETKCPLCDKDNACQNIMDKKSCWCQRPEYNFSEDLLSRVPVELKNKTCICQSCADEYRKINP